MAAAGVLKGANAAAQPDDGWTAPVRGCGGSPSCSPSSSSALSDRAALRGGQSAGHACDAAEGGDGLERHPQEVGRSRPDIAASRARGACVGGRALLLPSRHRLDRGAERLRRRATARGAARARSPCRLRAACSFPTWRSWVRKAFEAPLALYTDLILSKRRILEIYLNIAEWGPASTARGGGGAELRRAAVEAFDAQAALLAAALPAPVPARRRASRSRGMSRVARRIAGRAARLGPAADCVA